MAKKKNGRPCKFSQSLVNRIAELAEAGKKDEEIAAAIGVATSTFSVWKKSIKGFKEALKDSKAVADQMVVASLYQRACGYSHLAVKMFYDKDSGNVVSKVYREHYPPDTTACIFWLKNRDREAWRDRHELTGRDGAPLTSPDTIAKVIVQLPPKKEK